MKKKIVAILLCVLIVCSLSIALVACDNDDDNANDYKGTWVGYVEGNKQIQIYAKVQELYTPQVGDPFYDITLYATTPLNTQFSSQMHYGKIIPSVGEANFETDINQVGRLFSASEISENKFVLTCANGAVVHFKRTDINEYSYWWNLAFGDNDEPYYYED